MQHVPALAAGRAEENYHRYLGINNLLTMDHGLRAETDKQTALTALYRNKEMLLALVGGKCSRCGTVQYPKTNVCVSPNCQATDTQEPHPFADMRAELRSFTADRLTYSPSPPAYYGMVQFAERAEFDELRCSWRRSVDHIVLDGVPKWSNVTGPVGSLILTLRQYGWDAEKMEVRVDPSGKVHYPLDGVNAAFVDAINTSVPSSLVTRLAKAPC